MSYHGVQSPTVKLSNYDLTETYFFLSQTADKIVAAHLRQTTESFLKSRQKCKYELLLKRCLNIGLKYFSFSLEI